MAKGRRYGAERLLAAPARFGGGGRVGCGAVDLPDLTEDEVWTTAFHAAASDDSAAAAEDDDDRWPRTGRASARRWVDRHVGGLSLAFEDAYRGAAIVQSRRERHRGSVAAATAASAPVNVPAWPRSLRAGSGGPPPEEEAEEAAEGDWLPPHEYLARAHGKGMATSVLEGVGRTLKGRDMSRVRDAVWSQTGFFG